MSALVPTPRSEPAGGDLAAAWDERVDRALAKAPDRLRRAVAWLRHPLRRWLRLPAAALFMLGGLLAILPVLGLWMLPLGLALLAEDVPGLKAWLESMARRGEALWRAGGLEAPIHRRRRWMPSRLMSGRSPSAPR